MIEGLFNKTAIPVLHKILDLSSMRQKAIASNVANAATPGYSRQDVSFDELLRTSAARGELQVLRSDPRHLGVDAQPRVPVLQTLQELKGEAGENAVNVEHEMAESVKNQQLYSSAAKLIAGSFKTLQASIRGRY